MEELLKSGRLPCLVATSSLELGIDMGAVDLVIQVESPKSVTRGLQRIGVPARPSRGRFFGVLTTARGGPPHVTGSLMPACLRVRFLACRSVKRRSRGYTSGP